MSVSNTHNSVAHNYSEGLPLIYRARTAYGLCLSVSLDIADAAMLRICKASLHKDEISFASEYSEIRMHTWMAGRYALRCALSDLGWVGADPILSDNRGAPLAPDGFSVSVSHKVAGNKVLAVALVNNDNVGRIGVDVELMDNPRPSISQMVLTAREMTRIEALPADKRWFESLLHFSLKEALYKAVDPYVRRYIDYSEAAVFPQADGSVRLCLEFAEAQALNLITDACWLFADGMILSFARSCPDRAEYRLITEKALQSEPIPLIE